MMTVGINEIVAGVLVFPITRIEVYVVLAWLVVMALNLIFGCIYVNVADRGFVVFFVARLSEKEW